MKRAHLVNFLAVKTDEDLAIRANLTMRENIYSSARKYERFAPKFPIQAYKLLNAYQFKIKIIGRDDNHQITFSREFESDSFGGLNIKIGGQEISRAEKLEIFEIGKSPGLEILLGNFIPIKITGEKKNLIICDFDKTLVDTKYSTPEEIYKSLTSPIQNFPTVTESVEMAKGYINKEYHPFILSASPHFYEEAMRDWLYSNDIYSAGIFLKDYRKIFSLLEGDLTPKDLKVQGIYKLNHLLDIIHMTGIPDKLVLMGDNFESDPIIYLTFNELLQGRTEPRELWNRLKNYEAFKLSTKQNSMFLNKIFQLSDIIRKLEKKTEVTIYIRKKAKEDELRVPKQFSYQIDRVNLYETPSTQK